MAGVRMNGIVTNDMDFTDDDDHSNNLDVVDKLISEGHITTPKIGQVFRCVEWQEYTSHPYKYFIGDIAQCTNFEEDNPVMHAWALEALNPQPGMKVLAIGSGCGYFNTLVGLMLDGRGMNYGIETNLFSIQNSKNNLRKFKAIKLGVDMFNFCEPSFYLGDPLRIFSTDEFDRIFIAGWIGDIPIEDLLKEHGILFKSSLDGSYSLYTKENGILNGKSITSFSSLSTSSIESKGARYGAVVLPQLKTSLQDICRNTVRTQLRLKIKTEQGEPLAVDGGGIFDIPTSYHTHMEQEIQKLPIDNKYKAFLSYTTKDDKLESTSDYNFRSDLF